MILSKEEKGAACMVVAILEEAGNRCCGKGFMGQASRMCAEANIMASLNLLEGLEKLARSDASVNIEHPLTLRLGLEQGLILMASHHPELGKEVEKTYEAGLTKKSISELAYKVAKELLPEKLLKDVQGVMTKLGEGNE